MVCSWWCFLTSINIDKRFKKRARYAYDIWGNIISKEGDIANPFTYGGQWGYIHDDESGLYFLKTRYYDPLIGRFISRDRFAGFENDPDSQNRYVYCNNDPVNNVDPSGCMAAAIVGIYLIPGIGEVVIIGTLIVVGGIVIGSALYWLISRWVEAHGRAQIAQASRNIPSKLKTPDGRVDLSKFNRKKPGSGPPTWIGPLGYMIQKDMAKHGGRVWKLLDWTGKRIASLAADGKILGK